MQIRPLDSRNKLEIHDLIMKDPNVNIFLLERLLHGNIQGWGIEEWHGVFVDRKLIAISFCGGRNKPLTRAKLFTGYGSLKACTIISEFQKKRGGFDMAIGEDQFIQSIVDNQNSAVVFNYEQDYMTCTKKDLKTDGSVLAIETAQMYDFEEIYRNSGLMILEDLGYNPCETQPKRQKELIKKRIEEKRILVAKIKSSIAFQIEVGVMLSLGCQVGSTYIPASYRGQGLSSQYMKGACEYLLEQTQSVNLYVHTGNIPAQRCYQKTGFQKIAKYRLVKYQ
jgi:ribosomal protein S18 acetylase RimI-like enzyme